MSDLEPRAKMLIYRPPISTGRLIMSTSNSYEHTPWNISMLHFDVVCATSKNNREICGHSVEKWFSLMEISMWIPHIHTRRIRFMKHLAGVSRQEQRCCDLSAGLIHECFFSSFFYPLFFFFIFPAFSRTTAVPYIYSSLLTSIKQHKIYFFFCWCNQVCMSMEQKY